MINFDAVDFSERRPEEVMFLLTLSVYILYRPVGVWDISHHPPGFTPVPEPKTYPISPIQADTKDTHA